METRSIKTLLKFLIGGSINCLSNSDLLNTFFKSGVQTGIGTLTGGMSLAPAVITSLINVVSGNVVSDEFKKIADSRNLWKWLKNDHPDKVNHDLEKMIKLSALNAFSFLEKLYLEETKNDEEIWGSYSTKERIKYISRLKSFFKYAKNELEIEIEYVKIEKEHIQKPEEIFSKLCEYIFLVPENITLNEHDQVKFNEFYFNKMPYCFELAFKEAIKDDERGFKAFEIWVLEDIKSINQHLALKVDELIEMVKINKPIGPVNLDLILQKQTEQILNILRQDFDAIDAKLEFIISDTKLIYQSAEMLSKDLTKLSSDIDSLIEQSSEILSIVKASKLYEGSTNNGIIQSVNDVYESELLCIGRTVMLILNDDTGRSALCQDEMTFRVLKDIETYDDVFSSDSSYLTDIKTHPGEIIKTRNENGKYIVTTKLDKKYLIGDILNYTSSCIYIDCHHESSSYFSVWSDYKMETLNILVCFPENRKCVKYNGFKKSSMLDRLSIELDSVVESIMYLGKPALRMKVDDIKLFDKYTISWEW